MATMFDWFFLPAEIRLTVLDLLAQENHGLASYASVCTEWADVIEKKNFHRLKLRASCLDDLEHMVSRHRRLLVRHIWLNIELEPYTCRSCRWPSFWTPSNDCIISRAISKLFAILATWDPAGDGLTLELSVQCPSDAEHWFQYCFFGIDGEENQLRRSIHDPKHGWVDGQQVTAPTLSSVMRLYDSVWLYFQEDLPVLQMVTKLVVRRQCRRRFHSIALKLLLDKLPRLECMVYEPWQQWDRKAQPLYDQRKQSYYIKHPLHRIPRFSDGGILAIN